MKKKYWVFAALLAFALLADQLTKIWARSSLKPRHEAIVVIEGFFDFRYSENTGSAFGMFRGWGGTRYLLLGVGVIALGVVVSFLRRTRDDHPRMAGELGLLAGGALGNIFDRLFHDGRVTDFILWKVKTYEWPVFNIADAALVVGVIGLLLDMRIEEKRARAAEAQGGKDDKGEGDKESAKGSGSGKSSKRRRERT